MRATDRKLTSLRPSLSLNDAHMLLYFTPSYFLENRYFDGSAPVGSNAGLFKCGTLRVYRNSHPNTQRVHVLALKGVLESYILSFGPMYVPHRYLHPLGQGPGSPAQESSCGLEVAQGVRIECQYGTGIQKPYRMWVVIKIMVPFWVS